MTSVGERPVIDLHDRVVLLTGAAGGMGRAHARLLAELGAKVLLADLPGSTTDALAEELGRDVASPVELDVTSAASWRAALSVAESTFHGVDILINLAGRASPSSLLEVSEANAIAVFDVNQLGLLLGIQIIGSHMVGRNGGTIVNVASIAASIAIEGSAWYGATKSAVVALTKSAALELGPSGIRVNAVLPGGVATPMAHNRTAFYRTLPLGRIGQPIEIANAVMFLASGASSYCTGACLVVDGGWTLGTTAASLLAEAGPL